MERQVVVSPEELYILGKLLNAQYIDYAYIAAVKEIGNNKGIFEKETIDKLVSKNLLEEDFEGNIVPKEETVALFKPVFFEYLESTIDICTMKEPVKIETIKFHFFDNHITKIKGVKDGLFEVESIRVEDLQAVIDALVSEESNNIDKEFDKDNISRLIVIKYIRIDRTTEVAVYIDSDNCIYKEEDGIIKHIEAKDFRYEITRLLAGVK